MKKYKYIYLLLCHCCLCFNSTYAQGVLYNIDFKNELTAFNGKGILGSLTDNVWNKTNAINTSNISLVDSKGNPSAVKLTSSGIDGTWNQSFAFGWGEFADYWVLKNNGNANITITNVKPGEKFELVLLCFGPSQGRAMKASLNGGTPKQTSGNGGALQWAPIPSSESNYIQFSGTVPADGKLSITLTCISDEADIQGLQLQVGNIVLPTLGNRMYQLGTDLKAGYDLKVMSIGTSLTDLPYGLSWPTELQNELWSKYQGHEIISNRAISGSNSRSGKENIVQWVGLDNPDVVFIEYGINDAEGVPMNEVRANLDFILSAILTNNPKADIIFQTMSNCIGSAATARPQLEAYYQLYRDYAAFRGYTLIDNYPLWKQLLETDPSLWATYLPDNIHPTHEGRLATVIENMAKGVESAKPRVVAPEMSFAAGKISIATTTPNAKIYYTLDGSIPTPNSTQYTSTFAYDNSKTIKAIALASAHNASIIVSSKDLITSSEEIVCNKDIFIYPNPANTNLYLSSDYSNPTSYEILTIQGKTIQTGMAGNFFIPIASLASGIYTVKIKYNDKILTHRFIKE